MTQLTPAILASITAMGCVAATAAVASPSQTTFLELCQTFQGTSTDWNSLLYSSPYAWQTMEALMSALGIESCELAEQRLADVQVLQPPQLETAYSVENSLMVDFPMGVDLQVIAIATPNLTALNLNGRVVQELAPIAALSQLQTLQLANTQLDDINPLPALTQLTSLDISYNQIESIAPVASIPTIRSLNVAYNPFTDVSPIGNILTPAVEQEWQLLDLSGIAIDPDTCPDNLGDICEGDLHGDI